MRGVFLRSDVSRFYPERFSATGLLHSLATGGAGLLNYKDKLVRSEPIHSF